MSYNDWKIGDSIGEGGQAQVYKATRNEDPMIYAIKVFKNPKREERSKTEILNMKSLKALGVNVPEIIDSGEYKDKRPYFVTIYYPNKSLEDQLNDGCKDIDRIKFVQELCIEIRKLNSVNYVHRDLKPANILLDQKWQPVIADFGLSRNTDDKTGYTKPGEPIGSTHYMHPKAFETKNIDRSLHYAFDGYSFGKMLFEILSGNKLYGFSKPDENEIESFKGVLDDPYVTKKVLRGIIRLLSENIDECSSYWSKFPQELEYLLSPSFKSSALDASTMEMIKEIYFKKINAENNPSKEDMVQPDEIKEEVLAYLKDCNTLQFLNELMKEVGNSETVQINQNANLREILEGVGVKSNYGIDPLITFGRKQSLVKLEILITPPRSNRRIGISLISNTPNTNLLLCTIIKSKDFLDIDQASILRIVIDDNARIDKSYLSAIDKYILNLIKE